jgi:DNA-binding CsgD family transcriptional regulator/predicted DNA-binding protein with PD1-like motif
MQRALEEVTRFATLLTRSPSVDDLLATLLRDFLSQEDVSAIEVQVIGQTEDLVLRYFIGAPIDGSEKKSVTSLSELLEDGSIHSDLEKMGFLYNFHNHITLTAIALDSTIKGFYLFQHGNRYESSLKTTHYIQALSSLMTLYLISQFPRGTKASLLGSAVKTESSTNLSARQLMILAGMVDGKTNPELSVALGYSVSTIRHETMDIFKILGVADRKEAAKSALASGLL